jgi:mRNA interferase YafQ
MRTIEPSTAFRRDFKREKKGPRGRQLDKSFNAILAALVNDWPLPEACRDHPLKGEWVGYRDCHVMPDLVLIYRKSDSRTLELRRLASHAELFGS